MLDFEYDEYPDADIPTISSFKELMNEISENWFYPTNDLVFLDDETLKIDELVITPEYAEYRDQTWVLSPGVFEQTKAFYTLINSHEKI